MNTPEGVRIERADARHQQDVLCLLAEHLPGSDVARRYAWLYEQNPHGRALTVIARDERSSEPLGITSVFPRRMYVAGRPIMGSVGGDGYVRPSARRRGIATALHRAALVAMRTSGVDAMVGPPEPHNLRALERAGARVVTQVRRYVRPRLVQALLSPMDRIAARGDRLDPVIGIDRRVDAIFERALDDRIVTPARDAAHCAFRFAESPAGAQRAFIVMLRDKPSGLCVLERRGGDVAILDLFAPASDFGDVLRAVIVKSDARSLAMQLNERGPHAEHLERFGFVPRTDKPFQVHAHEGADPALFDATRWFYTWADGDLDRLL